MKKTLHTAAELLSEDLELESEWFASYGDETIDFIYDGPTDYEAWIRNPLRILCLFKEAFGGGRWNHAHAIKQDNGLFRVSGGANQAMHYRTIEWLYALEKAILGEPFDVDHERANDYPAAREVMLRSAWVNIKKANGLSKSNYANLSEVLVRDHAFLAKQIELLNPKIVLCGNTFSVAKPFLFADAERIAGTDFSHITPSGVIVIDAYHPGRKPKESYLSIVSEARKILGSGALSV